MIVASIGDVTLGQLYDLLSGPVLLASFAYIIYYIWNS